MSTSGMFTRLRAKLTSQQIPTKEVAALAEREEEANKKALNKSISDAVLEALRNEEFIKSVAVQLASELQPSFQGLSPSVFNDKLQAHIEVLKNRFDVQDTKLTHLSTILESNNLSTAEKICKIEEVSNSILNSQGEHRECIKAAEENQNAQFTSIGTEIASVQEKITVSIKSLSDQVESIKSQIKEDNTTSLSEINAHLKIISKTLEEQSTKLAEIKDVASSSEVLAKIQASNDLNTTQVAALSEVKELTEKSLIEFSNVHTNTSAISSALDSNISQTDEIKNLLTEINNSKINEEILAETKASNDLNTTQVAALSEVKALTEKSLIEFSNVHTNTSAISSALDSNISQTDEIKNLLTEINNSKINEEILAETKASNESLVAVNSTLGEIKSNQSDILPSISASNDALKSLGKDLEDIKLAESNVIDNVKSASLTTGAQGQVIEDLKNFLTNNIATIDGITSLAQSIETLRSCTVTMNASLDDIKSTVSRPPPIAEKVDLSKLESSVETITSDISQIKSAHESLLGETHLMPVLSTLDSHSSLLTDIKSTVTASLQSADKFDLSSLESSVKDLSSMLESQISSFDELKKSVTALESPEKIDISGLESSIQKIDLSGLESLIRKIDLSGLESSIQKIDLSGLESSIQKIDLSGLESSIQKIDLSGLESLIQKIDLSGLESSVQKIIQTLESQKEALINSNTPAAS